LVANIDFCWERKEGVASSSFGDNDRWDATMDVWAAGFWGLSSVRSTQDCDDGSLATPQEDKGEVAFGREGWEVLLVVGASSLHSGKAPFRLVQHATNNSLADLGPTFCRSKGMSRTRVPGESVVANADMSARIVGYCRAMASHFLWDKEDTCFTTCMHKCT
jgi:hypothetical protein